MYIFNVKKDNIKILYRIIKKLYLIDDFKVIYNYRK